MHFAKVLPPVANKLPNFEDVNRSRVLYALLMCRNPENAFEAIAVLGPESVTC